MQLAWCATLSRGVQGDETDRWSETGMGDLLPGDAASVRRTTKGIGSSEGVRAPPDKVVATEVGQPGIEPGTSVLSGLRSNRLSYWPICERQGGELLLLRENDTRHAVGIPGVKHLPRDTNVHALAERGRWRRRSAR